MCIRDRIDPIRGIMSGQLKLKGNMMTVLKSPKAATEPVSYTHLNSAPRQ